jgi:hypothetical protein
MERDHHSPVPTTAGIIREIEMRAFFQYPCPLLQETRKKTIKEIK